MQLFERDIESILEEIKSMDFDVRRQAIKDLAISSYKDKINLLGCLCRSEQDIQLKYEIRKAINELDSLKSQDKLKTLENYFINLRKAFQSADKKVVLKAFEYALEHRLDEFLPEMMMIENYTRDPFHRTFIIRLMHRSSFNYFKQIIDYLKDNDSRVVSTAIELLEEIGNTTALASIVRLTEHPNNRVKASAIKAIHNLGDEKSFELFAKMIQSPHSAYRDSAAYSLSQICTPEGIKLLSILLIDEVESVRVKALAGLEKMADLGDSEALDILHRLTNEKPYGLWADKLIELMTESADKEATPKLSDNLLKNPNLKALFASYLNSSKLKLTEIEKITEKKSDNENAKIIIERLKLEKNSRVIASAILDLGKATGSKQLILKTLKSYINHCDERIRANSIEALTRITLPRERRFLVKSLQDSNNRVKGNAIVALWENSINQSEYALNELIKSSLKDHQLTAIYCIGELADWKLAEFCRDLLTSPHLQVREQMEKTMEHLRDISAFANVLEDWKTGYKEQDLKKINY